MKTGFTLTYAQLSGPFTPTLQKLCRMPLPTKVAYQVKKMTDAIQVELKKMRSGFTSDVLEAHAKKNEDGTFAKDEHGDVVVDESKQESFDAAQKAFGEKSFTINRDKLSLAFFENVSLSAAELSALDPILQDPEESPEAEVVQLRK